MKSRTGIFAFEKPSGKWMKVGNTWYKLKTETPKIVKL